MKRSSNSNWISPCFQQPAIIEDDVFSDCKKFKDVKKPATKRSHHFSHNKLRKRKIDDDVPWAEKFAPTSKDELAVHKKKVSEVEDWLKANLNLLSLPQCQRPGILLLTGPAGVGKTAVIKALGVDLQFEITEWSSGPFESMPYSRYNDEIRQPNDVMSNITHQSQTAVFSNFLLRVNKYPSLFSTTMNRIILVEEFPNIYLKDAVLFHNLLRKFYRTIQCPAVFIVSDCTSGESLETHLFPKNLQLELNITNISFNPVAPTMLVKALNRICSLVKDMFSNSNCNDWRKELEDIAMSSMGDVRSAINALQFLSIQKKHGLSQSSATSCLKPKKNRKNETNQTSYSQRDSSLFLFHALGKILYSKRDNTKPSNYEKLPVHLSHLERVPLIANPEEVFEKTSVSAENFVLFLHENYSAFVDDIDVAAEASSYFSQADVISVEWAGREVLRDYTASVAARGLMFNLKPNISSQRWRPLHKPQFYGRIKENYSLSMSLKNSFKDTRLSLKELETEFIPYLFKIGDPSLSIDKSRLVSQIGQIAVKKFSRPQYESLCEKDFVDDDVPSQLENQTQKTSETLSSATDLIVPEEKEEEEIVIEEYDF